MKYAGSSRCALNKKNKGGISSWRIYALFFLFFTVAGGVFFRLYSLQVLSYESYKALAAGQHDLFKKLVPNRGEIFLKGKDGIYPAAVNKGAKMAYAVPKEIENVAATAEALAGLLQLDRGELENKLGNPEDVYEVLKHRLSPEEESGVERLQLEGVRLSEEVYRYYPSNELAANVLGFVGWKDSHLGGRYGVEASFDSQLTGQEGNVFHKKDASGKWISVTARDLAPAKDGWDLVLTIDHIVQYETEKILKGAVEKNEADSGSIIVMEPDTGKILAMASYPTFNPNEYSKVEDIGVYRNPIVSDAYECGSVFKPVTMAAGVDNGKINAGTTYVDAGAVQEAGYAIKNAESKVYGKQTMTGVLEHSINTGVIYVEKLLGNRNFSDYVKRFGFGEKTGVGLMGEGAGNISNLNNLKSTIQFFTASFGQGITVTPLQLAAAYSAIANGGDLMRPRIIEKIIRDGEEEESVEPEKVRRVISSGASQEVTKMLESVVLNGHGKRAGVPGYRVGGKTGTAQVASSSSKGYDESTNIGSFAGFAPLDNPKFTIVVRINNPRAVQWAESSAAPASGELMKFLLDYYNIEPTEEYTQQDLDLFNQTHNLKDYLAEKKGESVSGTESAEERNRDN